MKNRKILITLLFLICSVIANAGSISVCKLEKNLPIRESQLWNKCFFLDELPEFSRSVLETMRQPLEDRIITISRARYTVQLPCSMMLVAAMNPCPCGYYNHPTRQCECSPGQVKRYMNKISGPLLDRIDLQIEVTPVPLGDLARQPQGEHSAQIRERVMAARQIQAQRFRDVKGVHCNAQMGSRLLHQYAEPDEAGQRILGMTMERLNLTARAYEKILKVARTIADLDGSPTVSSRHISEAVGYRNLDRSNWGE